MQTPWTHPAAVSLLLALLGGASAAMAEVTRCVDAAGKVAYTDGQCPAGTRAERSVATQAPVEVLPDPAADAAARRQAARSVAEDERLAARQAAAAAPGTAPAGPVIMDSRGNPSAAPTTREEARAEEAERWSQQTGDPLVVEPGWSDGYAYGSPYPPVGGFRPPPRDQRPRIRGCDETGCRDRLGNTYNRQGQLDRYQSLDNKTCRPVGTTVVCR
jgi:hypothetical protein